MSKKLLFLTAIVFLLFFISNVSLAQILIRMVKVSQTSSEGTETLVIDIDARSISGSSVDFNVFTTSFVFDSNLRDQNPTNDSYSEHFTNIEKYTKIENMDDGISVTYLWNYSDPKGTIGTSWTQMVRVTFEFTTAGGVTSTISWGSSHQVVEHVTNLDVYLQPVPDDLEAPDFTLPVEISSILAVSNPGDGIKLTWRTESEVQSSGFHVWRSDHEDGIYTRVTPGLILSHGNSTTAHEYSFHDETAQDDFIYWYKIQELSISGVSTFFGPVMVEEQNIPTGYNLAQNYPNPFNSETLITFNVPENSFVDIGIYNALGQKIATLVKEDVQSGVFTAQWNGTDDFNNPVVSGVYLVRMIANDFTDYKKIMFMK